MSSTKTRGVARYGLLILALIVTSAPVGVAQDGVAQDGVAQDGVTRRDRLTLRGLDREPLTAADLEQGATLLVVWASWSPRCRDVAARIDHLAKTWSGEARVASVVFQEDPETVRAVARRAGLSTPVYLDLSGDFSKQHAVTTLPMLLIFRDGELAFRGKLAASPDPVIERTLRSPPLPG